MAERRAFPMLPHYGELTRRAVPWDFVAPHEARAHANHEQTLERLAERGGLAECELVALLEDRPWRAMDRGEADARLNELLAAWEANHG